ncbi:potassium/proton antiporter [Paenisporosarcina cavernae]|uniref:Potassium/proton antiporter n=1 Tax=Paenisporosarcina cavernae TaxID=2320858 RepID=A0A385YW25_9BACL|nr:potassium/proton antiporter [Paenisporosarcina cavernae]AYC30490.1 potassium/proton antiporter [Paenisporosarcina cavernae]
MNLAIETDTFILLAGILFIAGVITTKFSSRLGVPTLILFLLVGITMGSDVLGIIYFDNALVAQLIGITALVIILFEGGIQTNWSTMKPVIAPSLSLATIGVLITSAIVTVAVKYIIDIDWKEAALFGSIVGSTDAAAVFAVLKGQNIRPKLGATLEAESGSNDPMAVFLTISFIQLITVPDESIWRLIASFFLQMGLGALLGLLMGKIAIFALNKLQLDSSGLYPVFATAFALLTFGLTDFLNGSGLLAVYIAAIMIGNADIVHRHSIFHFSEGFAWMMQIAMFVMLGLLVFPSQLFQWKLISSGLLITIILVVVARPIAVFVSTWKMDYTMNEKIFLSWAGLKGAVPIVLATFPLLAGIENNQMIFNVVFFVVLISATIQGSTVTLLASKLGLMGEQKNVPMHSLELVSLGKTDAQIVEYELREDTLIVGQSLSDIPFPSGSLVNAVIRNDELITPGGDTILEAGDFLYILTSKESKPHLKTLLQKKNDTYL